jgi:hypothetical protein
MPEDLPRAARAEYLTDALRRAGALGAGRVRDVVVESSKATILSRIIRLRLSYDGPATDAPASLILKTGLPERADARRNPGQYEVAFYTQVAAAIPEAPVPCCFDAVWNEDTNDWHLLLEDLTDSHFTLTYWPMPPTRPQSEAIVAARARFHAALWDDPRLGTSRPRLPARSSASNALRAEAYLCTEEVAGSRVCGPRHALHDARFSQIKPSIHW